MMLVVALLPFRPRRTDKLSGVRVAVRESTVHCGVRERAASCLCVRSPRKPSSCTRNIMLTMLLYMLSRCCAATILAWRVVRSLCSALHLFLRLNAHNSETWSIECLCVFVCIMLSFGGFGRENRAHDNARDGVLAERTISRHLNASNVQTAGNRERR